MQIYTYFLAFFIMLASCGNKMEQFDVNHAANSSPTAEQMVVVVLGETVVQVDSYKSHRILSNSDFFMWEIEPPTSISYQSFKGWGMVYRKSDVLSGPKEYNRRNHVLPITDNLLIVEPETEPEGSPPLK